MKVIKRNGNSEKFIENKILTAIKKAYKSVNIEVTSAQLQELTNLVVSHIKELNIQEISIEVIQDIVEKTLMETGQYEVLKAYILYREKQANKRVARKAITTQFTNPHLDDILKAIQMDFDDSIYRLQDLGMKFFSFSKENMSETEKLDSLVRAAVELTTQEAPLWEYIAARILLFKFDLELKVKLQEHNIKTFYEKLVFFDKQGLYGKYILASYSQAEIDEIANLIDNSCNHLLTYSALDLLLKRYVIQTKNREPIETPQEMFLGIAMHLALNEKDRIFWVKKFYNILSKLKITMATPTLANARKPYHQLSSCFIDTVPDNLEGIYRSIDNFAQVSKLGGGMGLYFGKVRASGSSIRGFKNAAGGVIRWIKLANDTAVAVDQLGVRQGAVAVYLDVWHKDIFDFLQLRTNNGDDRRKAHDVFPAVSYPDLFWKTVRDNIEGNWYLFDPHEILTIKGYALEDSFGDEWEQKYLDCINDSRISKTIVPIKEIVRMVIKSAVETGTPFTFNRDHVNRMNPNSHKGIIYSSNLCTEIAQNMSQIESVNQTIETINGETVVVSITKPGDFVVCNLASLALGNINTNDEQELSEVVKTTVRALDNVIDLNYYPLPYAKITNSLYRPIGLGVSGYHHMLAKNLINWESDKHLQYVDNVFEKINFAAIEASMEIAREKGKYQYFPNSEWDTGAYFQKRNYTSLKWQALHQEIKKHGMRNGYLLAIAPTSSTSIIAGTTAGLDPIMQKYFLEEKKSGLVPRVAPELNNDNFWLYKSAHTIDQTWVIRAAGVRGRHIDQAQSLNIYITNDYSFRQILNLYVLAWEQEVKTIYYIRSKSLEVEECESCSS